MSRRPAMIIPLVLVVVSALSPAKAKADPPGHAGGPSLLARPIRMATLRVNVVLNELCKDDIEKLGEEVRERYHLPAHGGYVEYNGDPERDVAFNRGILARKTAIYAKQYERLERVVAEYCKAEGIDLVLNDDRPADKVDPDDADTVARDKAKRVVLTTVDITPAILKRLAAKPDPAVKTR